MRIVFGAIVSRHPLVPGSVWNRMQWVTGLRRLGHEVVYVEELRPKWCVDESGQSCEFADCINRQYFARTMQRFGLNGSCCQLYNGGEQTTGLSVEALAEFVSGADLLINQSGHVTSDLVLDGPRQRAYVDQDPVYTQLWRSEYGKDLGFSRHEAFVTVGLNIGTRRSPIPVGGIAWHHVLPPVVPEFWHGGAGDSSVANDEHDEAPFTTLASLSGYGDLCYQGTWYRAKYDEFRRFADLPRRTSRACEVTLRAFRDNDEAVQLLRDGGWIVRRSPEVEDLDGYRRYIATSRGEIGIGKGAYIHGRSGWFSDRTACYLASGKPCLVQSTGIEHHLPTGDGIVTFHDMGDAVTAMRDINARYDHHCQAAREFALEFLDYRKVLPAMLEKCMAPAALYVAKVS
jgi:hypothetical protein